MIVMSTSAELQAAANAITLPSSIQGRLSVTSGIHMYVTFTFESRVKQVSALFDVLVSALVSIAVK